MVNDMLAKAKALPQLARHDSWDWHLHAVADTAPLATRITVDTAMAMVDLIRADELSRLGVCADDACDGHRARPVPQPLTAVLLARPAATATRSPPTARASPRATRPRRAARSQEPAEHLDEHRRLLGVHPVAGVLDGHPAHLREVPLHGRGMLVADVRRGLPRDPEHRAVVRRQPGRGVLGPAAQRVEVVAEHVEVDLPAPAVTLAAQVLQEEGPHDRIGHAVDQSRRRPRRGSRARRGRGRASRRRTARTRCADE